MIFLLFVTCSFSLDICISSKPNDICPNDALTLTSLEKIEDILKQNINIEEHHLNIFIDNTYKTPIFLNSNDFQRNSFTATLIGKKESSFAIIDFCGKEYDDRSVFSYNGVTIYPKNTSGLSVGCVYTKNADFQFYGFDNGKIFSRLLNKHNKMLPKSIISYDNSGDYTFTEFELFPMFTHVLIKESSIILTVEGQSGSMKLENLRKGTLYLFQKSYYNYLPLTIYTDVTNEVELPFFYLGIIKSTQLTVGKFPKQPSGIPPFGIEVSTSDEITINGASSDKSKFVLFDSEPSIKKSLKVTHCDICPYHFGTDKIDKISIMFKNLIIDYGSILKISQIPISIQADKIQTNGYSLRQVDEIQTYDGKIFQKVSLSQEMNYLKLTDQKFTISEGSDKSPKYQIDTKPNLFLLVLQNEDSSTSLTIDTQSSTQSLNNLPNIELLLTKESTLSVISNLQNNQDSHYQIFGNNLGKPVTIQSSNGNGFTFGLTGDTCGEFIIDGAKIELQDVEVVNVGQLTIKSTEFIKMNQNSNPIVSITNLYVNSDFVDHIPHLSVLENFHILGDAKSGQVFPCQQGPNVFLDIPAEFDNVEIDSPNILLTNSNREKTVTFENISNSGHIYFTQKSSSPTLYSINLTYTSDDKTEKNYGTVIFEFIDDSSVSNTVNFVGDSWKIYSNEKSLITELRSSHQLTVNFDGIIPAKIINDAGGELTLIPAGTKFGFIELQLSGKMAISHESKDKFEVFLKTFAVESTASFSIERETEINASQVIFDLGTFDLLKSSKLKILPEITSIFLFGNTELTTDFTLTYNGNDSSPTKLFTLKGPTTTACTLSIEDYTINYRRNDHTLTFKNFVNSTSIYLSSENEKIETTITSLQLNFGSSFVFDNTVVLKGVVKMDYKSFVYGQNNGKIIFSPIHDFIAYFNLSSQYFPSIYAEKVAFEGKPFAFSMWQPGEKDPGYKFSKLLGYTLRAFCLPNFDCSDFIDCVDIEHPFKDGNYSFKPVCTIFEGRECIAFNITRDIYKPTPTRLPMPTIIPATPSETPSSSPHPAPSEAPIVPDDSKPRKKNKGGMIAGIIIGVVAGLALIGVLIWYLRKKAKEGGFKSFDPSLTVKLTENNAL